MHMAGELSSLVLLVLSSCMLVGGQNCSLSPTQFHFRNVAVSAKSVGGSSPGVRVTWNATVPSECVTSVRVEFRLTSSHGTSSRSPVVATYTTTNTSQTEIIQTGLQCGTTYNITVVLTGEPRISDGMPSVQMLSPQHPDVQVLVGDIPIPFGVRAEVTADNTSIGVSWEWSCQGVLDFDLLRVHYQPEGGSLMVYPVDNTTATSATLPNLQCNTEYTVWVCARGGQINRTSAPGMISLPARAPPTPTDVTAQFTSTTTVRVAWQWTSSDLAPSCFNTTYVTYRPEGGGESSLQLSDPAATKTTLTGLQCNTNYTITVVATAGEHRRESVAMTVLLPQGSASMCPGSSDGPGVSTDPGQTDNSPSSSNTVLVAGAAVSVVVVVLAAACIVVLVVWLRHRRGHGKDAAMELDDMADTNNIDSKEEQDTDMFFDNSIYAKVLSKQQHGKNASVELTDMVGRGSAENKEEQDMATSVDNVCYDKLLTSPPTIVDYQREVQCLEGEQVSLRVKFAGIPAPTVTWFFNGRRVEDDYSTELGRDGSLVLVSVELKHAGTYTFTLNNRVGSVEGCTKLVVHTEDKENASVPRVESSPVAREKLGEYVSSFHAHNNSAFIGQFQILSSGEEGHQLTIGKIPENRLLNRFKNIAPYDGHRVVLKSISDGVDCEHDYINATYIDGYSQGKMYIATQGPLPNTVTDFWWLVWQEQVRVVAMVTNTVERGQQKCEQYWPDEGTKVYGPFKVTLGDQQVFADYTIRQLLVSCDKVGGSQLKVTQFHFTSWPDHGVPEYAGPILNYLCRMKAQMKLSRGPTLVHCSAGIGRTGTLIAIDVALEQAVRESVVDIPAIVTKMRSQRMKMVQNSDQYVFIHDAVLESLTCGDTQIPASGLSGTIEKLKEKDRETGRTGFETQFHVLGLVTPKPTEVIRASAIRFPDLNRSLDFLPPENWRVTLKGEIKDYIHASFANGYKHRRGFIIAQAPMKSTCRDFWKMVYERECGVIVMLSDLVENGEEVCYQYWPSDDTKGVQKYGEFTVSVLKTMKENGFIQRNMSITNPKSGQEHKVTQFQMSCWTPEGLCTSPPAIMAVIEHVLVIQRRTGNKPIVVHGSDTVSRCGVLCSFINATECCKTEGIVDVFQVVKALRIQKPGSVLTVEQYCFIFDLMVMFLESFNIYSNFK